MNGGDVRMVRRGKDAGLAFEAHDPFGVGGAGLRQDLARDAAIESDVAGAIDFAHSACANRLLDVEHPDASAGQAGHGDILHQLAGEARRP